MHPNYLNMNSGTGLQLIRNNTAITNDFFMLYDYQFILWFLSMVSYYMGISPYKLMQGAFIVPVHVSKITAYGANL